MMALNMTDQYSCFEEAEQALNFTLKNNIKDILIINGYDNKVVLSHLEKSDFEEIEDYIRNDYHHLLSHEERNKLYGIYKENPQSYKISSGTKKQIALVVAYYKSKYDTTRTDQSTQTDFDNTISENISKTHFASNIQNTQLSGQVSDTKVDTEMDTEKTCIIKTLKSWVRTKVNSKLWTIFEKKIEEFDLKFERGPSNNLFNCTFTCFCKHTCKIQKISKKQSFQPRWIYSNIHKHILNKHVNIGMVATEEKNKKRSITQTVTDFFTATSCSSSTIVSANNVSSPRKPKILQNISLKEPFINSTLDSTDAETDRSQLLSNPKSRANMSPKHPSIIVEHDMVEGEVEKTNDKDCVETSNTSKSTVSKWKSGTYQRMERSKRKREDVENNQLTITRFFPILKEVTNIFHSNPNLIMQIDETLDTAKEINLPSKEVSGLLRMLCEISLKNTQQSKYKNTYDDVIKKLGLYLYYIGGRLLYEVLYTNLKNSLPSISTLNRFVSGQNKHFDEGNFDFENLRAFLDERNLPSVIWVSEDGTRITGKIQYNSKNNTVMGFALPLKNGIPVKNTYLATSAKVIQEYFQNCQKANYAYVIMAQPLDKNAPAYCLSVYSTDNCFTYKDVLQRWKYLEHEADCYGIKILGYSSDGDTRLLKAMRVRSKLPSKLTSSVQTPWPWFQIDSENNQETIGQSFVQDEVHIGTKLRNRLLKPNINLPIGNFCISVNHLQQLLETRPKDTHFLTLSDINPMDKMNFKSVEKITSLSVLRLLKEIPEAQGTVSYLKVISYILNAFLDKTSDIEDKLYFVWYAVFYLRMWRQWIKDHKIHKLKDNFITDNAYLCVELNAHSLIRLICVFRDNNLNSDMFCPWLFSSQSCERIFRTTRSMTTTMSTVVNFSIKDIIERIGRIKVVNNIIEDLKDTVIFPREKKSAIDGECDINFKKFTNEYIAQTVEKALRDASKEMQDLGVSVQDDCWNYISIKLSENIENDMEQDGMDRDVPEYQDYNLEDPTQNQMSNNFLFDYVPDNRDSDYEINDFESTGGSNLRDYSDKVQDVTESCQFIKIDLGNGKSAVIKKSTYCWLLEEEKGRVSTDRLRRFIGTTKSKGKAKMEGQKKRKKDAKYLEGESSCEEDKNGNISLDDITDSEVDDQMEVVDKNTEPNHVTPTITLQADCYYAVYYEEQWYVGRIVEKCENGYFKFQFLRQDLETFMWPKRTPDVAEVHNKYVFYGPIDLLGNGPFQIKRHELIKIKETYKRLKKELS